MEGLLATIGLSNFGNESTRIRGLVESKLADLTESTWE